VREAEFPLPFHLSEFVNCVALGGLFADSGGGGLSPQNIRNSGRPKHARSSINTGQNAHFGEGRDGCDLL
jgi:hypothetical protein